MALHLAVLCSVRFEQKGKDFFRRKGRVKLATVNIIILADRFFIEELGN